ncbi:MULTISPECIES: putative holin-like toxin [Sutcliffiella]|nr:MULTISPECIES: putative holin-like toxin [Sutcliffiella]WBL14773.1 putative holin-like toxin [Sutcliffiella sp. NC1]
MVTYEAMNMLFHFGMLIIALITATVTVITLVIHRKEK